MDSIPTHLRTSWLEVFRACQHRADPEFLQLLQTPNHSFTAQASLTSGSEDAKNRHIQPSLVGEPLARANAGIPRYFTQQASKRFDWGDTTWLCGDEKQAYAKRVKAFQRRGLPFVQAWYNFCKVISSDYTDPTFHTVPNMQRFLKEMESMERELPAGSGPDFFHSRLEQAFNGGLPSTAANDAKLTDPSLIQFAAHWQLHLDSKRLLASLPEHVAQRVVAEFRPKDTSKDVNGLFRKFAEGKQVYMSMHQ
eukprot:TRINITY_DN77970_c0_g1_i1.p1 TRINITY_DN77970_c0_g1~~TRINITY_DN77970_c0_g1_i1.p1  ORF type:complete len:251 (-),score=37.98 TRINITY_DN77970_c0_g1_i1:78-830(-)